MCAGMRVWTRSKCRVEKRVCAWVVTIERECEAGVIYQNSRQESNVVAFGGEKCVGALRVVVGYKYEQEA